MESGSMTLNRSETDAKVSIQSSKFDVGVSFGGERKNWAKTQWGENPNTQWGDKGDSQWGVDWINVGDHVDGHIPSGGDVSPNNPWKVDGTTWDNWNKNPLDL